MIVVTESRWLTIWLLFGALVIVYNASAFLLLRHLRNAHPDLWSELGRPSFLNSSISSTASFVWFLLRGGGPAVPDDPTLRRRIATTRLLFLGCSAVFLALLLKVELAAG